MLKWRCCHGLNYTDLRKTLSSVGSFESSASIREAYIYRLGRLDVYDTVYVFDIDQLKRLCRFVVVALDVDAFSIRFPFDIVTFGDVTKNDGLHDSSFQEMKPLRFASR